MIYTRRIDPNNLSPEDEKLIREWLAKDETHQKIGIKFEDFFEEGAELVLVSDERGPISFVRFHLALRAAMQFNPDAAYRNAKTGAEVADWFRQVASEVGANEVIIRPGGKAVRFTEKLGFSDFNGKYIET